MSETGFGSGSVTGGGVWSSSGGIGVVMWDISWLVLEAWGTGWSILWSVGSGAWWGNAVDSERSVVSVAFWEVLSGSVSLRPGAAPCAFFAKTGNCSYGGSCKWDHPEEFCQPGGQSAQAAAPGKPRQAVATPHGPPQSTGLPTRPGVQACVFYLKMGTCSFGATCKWDHPLGQGASGGADSGPQRTNGFTARATPY
jgi:hypothetical protein